MSELQAEQDSHFRDLYASQTYKLNQHTAQMEMEVKKMKKRPQPPSAAAAAKPVWQQPQHLLPPMQQFMSSFQSSQQPPAAYQQNVLQPQQQLPQPLLPGTLPLQPLYGNAFFPPSTTRALHAAAEPPATLATTLATTFPAAKPDGNAHKSEERTKREIEGSYSTIPHKFDCSSVDR